MQNSEPITLSPPSYPASLVLPTHSSLRRPSRRRPVARIVASIDVALAISRRGPPLSSRRHAISPLPSHRLSSPIAFPLPLPFLRRFPLPSPFLSRCPSSLPSPFLSPDAYSLSRRPSFLPSPFLSPVALSFSRLLSSLPSPVFSPVAPPLPSSSLPSPFISPGPSPTSASSRSPRNACPSPRRPVIVGPSRFSLAALLSPSHMPSLFSSLLAAPSSPPSHHPRCPLSPPITLFLSVRITPLITLTLFPHIVRHHRVTLSLSPHITLLVAVALPLILPLVLPVALDAAVAISSPTHHHPPHRLPARHKTPSRPPPTFSSHCLPRRLRARTQPPPVALPLSLPITDLVALVLAPKCLPIAFRLFSPIISNALSAPFLPPLTICLSSPPPAPLSPSICRSSLPSHPVVPPLYPPIPSFFLSPLPSRCSSSLPSYPVVLPPSPPIPSFPLSPLLSRRPPCPQSLLFVVDQSTVPTPFIFSYIIHFFISIFFA
ncbi:unnamed protein product [Closterium sp. Naga37s-1]|nr:unnamed protein product [Closterium sp. Naga37s-1]